MKRAFPLTVFAVVFAAVYIICFVNGWTWLRYYPLTGEISTLDLPRTEGPAMGWYSWILQGFLAALAASVLALAVPQKLAQRIWPGIAWVGIVLISAYTFYYEWHWFRGELMP